MHGIMVSCDSAKSGHNNDGRMTKNLAQSSFGNCVSPRRVGNLRVVASVSDAHFTVTPMCDFFHGPISKNISMGFVSTPTERKPHPD